MVRINIMFDRKTLRLADREARRRKTSRSNFIRSAIHLAAEQSERTVAEAAQRERRRKAIEGIRQMAQKFGDWPAERILHDMRYRLGGGRG